MAAPISNKFKRILTYLREYLDCFQALNGRPCDYYGVKDISFENEPIKFNSDKLALPVWLPNENRNDKYDFIAGTCFERIGFPGDRT
jgi:hypothetical protein